MTNLNHRAVDWRAEVLDGFLVGFLLRQLFETIVLSVSVTHRIKYAWHFPISVPGHLIELHSFSSFGNH